MWMKLCYVYKTTREREENLFTGKVGTNTQTLWYKESLYLMMKFGIGPTIFVKKIQFSFEGSEITTTISSLELYSKIRLLA